MLIANRPCQLPLLLPSIHGLTLPLDSRCGWTQAGSTKLIQLLLKNGADPTAASESGVTPLMILAAAGHVRGLRLILETAKGEGSPPDLITRVVDATTENGTAALHTAARQAHVKVVSELLGAGASAALRDLGGQSALGAAYDGLQAVAKYVEEALAEYSSTADKKLSNDMLARAVSAAFASALYLSPPPSASRRTETYAILKYDRA